MTMKKVRNTNSSKKKSTKERTRQKELMKEGREHNSRTKGKRSSGEETPKKQKQKQNKEDRHLPRCGKETQVRQNIGKEMDDNNKKNKDFFKRSKESMETISDIRQDLGLTDEKKKKEKYHKYENDVKDLISTYKKGLALIFSISGDDGTENYVKNPRQEQEDRKKSITKKTNFGGVTHSLANSAMGAYGNYLSELRDEHNSAIVTLMRVSSKGQFFTSLSCSFIFLLKITSHLGPYSINRH